MKKLPLITFLILLCLSLTACFEPDITTGVPRDTLFNVGDAIEFTVMEDGSPI